MTSMSGMQNRTRGRPPPKKFKKKKKTLLNVLSAVKSLVLPMQKPSADTSSAANACCGLLRKTSTVRCVARNLFHQIQRNTLKLISWKRKMMVFVRGSLTLKNFFAKKFMNAKEKLPLFKINLKGNLGG